MTWTPPVTHELATPDGRVVRYCRYGPPDGTAVVSLPGVPSTRWERPAAVASFERAGLRVLVPDRPGYAGSTRRPGRVVADVAQDVRLLAEAQGWARFAVTGHSGGGPHALACAALLPDLVTRCAAVSAVAPPDADGLDFFGDDLPGRGDTFRLAARGEPALRPFLERTTADSLARWGADADADSADGRDRRLRAMFVDGVDGRVDDYLALVRPWGFDVAAIAVPVGVWFDRQDVRSPRSHAEWLLSHVPAAERHEYSGGHDPDDDTSREILDWLAK